VLSSVGDCIPTDYIKPNKFPDEFFLYILELPMRVTRARTHKLLLIRILGVLGSTRLGIIATRIPITQNFIDDYTYRMSALPLDRTRK